MLNPLALTSLAINDADLPAVSVPGLYVHVPFCFHKCHYCDFYSITRQTEQRMTRFVDLLLAEADQWTAQPTRPTCRPRTVFFGGGTPTVLPILQMRRLLEGLKHRFDFSQVQEWTIEANPATVTAEYCRMMRQAGVDRLSFGAQSFRQQDLATLERHHQPEDVGSSFQIARQAGFVRLNLDLIYAIPGQDAAAWAESLHRALALSPPHISCYGLTYEPNTAIAVKKRLGQLRPVDDEQELAMLHHARRVLAQANCPAYEISNYATPGEECRHNLLYWMGEDYIGLGPSAASHVQGRRWRNRPHLGEWEQAIEQHHLPATDFELLSPQRRAGELVMLMLRLTRGVDFEDFTLRSGFDARSVYAEQLARFGELGLLEIGARGFGLSERGIDVADAIAAEFLIAEG